MTSTNRTKEKRFLIGRFLIGGQSGKSARAFTSEASSPRPLLEESFEIKSTSSVWMLCVHLMSLMLPAVLEGKRYQQQQPQQQQHQPTTSKQRHFLFAKRTRKLGKTDQNSILLFEKRNRFVFSSLKKPTKLRKFSKTRYEVEFVSS